jgi:hypothetical protein
LNLIFTHPIFSRSHDERFRRRGKTCGPFRLHRLPIKVLHEAPLAIPELPASLDE